MWKCPSPDKAVPQPPSQHPSDANGDRLFVAIHHVQHGIFGARRVVGSHQGALAPEDVDGILVRRGHEAKALGWDAASFVPGVCRHVVDLDIPSRDNHVQ